MIALLEESAGIWIASAFPLRCVPVFATCPMTLLNALGSSMFSRMIPFAPYFAAFSRMDSIICASLDQFDSPFEWRRATSRYGDVTRAGVVNRRTASGHVLASLMVGSRTVALVETQATPSDEDQTGKNLGFHGSPGESGEWGVGSGE